jgi:hypothetical protein
MPALGERVAYLEGTVGEHTQSFADLQHAMGDLRTGLTDLRTDMHARFAHVDTRFVQVDQRLAQMDARLVWLVGTQFAVLLAVIAALSSAYYR